MKQNKINLLLKILICKRCEESYLFKANLFECLTCGDRIYFEDDILYCLKRKKNIQN